MSDTTAGADTATDSSTDTTTTDATTDQATTDTSVDTGTGDNTDNGEDSEQARKNRQAARYRTERNQLQQQLEQANAERQTLLDNMAKALGLKSDDTADPAQQVTALTGQVENLTSENASLRAELLVHTIAGDNGGNPVALLDSRAFTTKLQGLDPKADDYGDQVAQAIKDAVSSNSSLRGGQAPSAGGADTAGQGASTSAAVTAEQFAEMDYQARVQLKQRDPALYRRLAGTA